MIAEELLQKCELEESLATLEDRVRREPGDPKQRIFLFQLLALLGDWSRAGSQLEVIGELDSAALPMVQTYREALRCEGLRAEIFAGRRSPLVLGEPSGWMALLFESLRLRGKGHLTEACELRDQAFEEAPPTGGTLVTSQGSTPFEWIADVDDRLGPMLEAVIQGLYYWVPFSHVQELHVEAPADLRDLVWAPVRFVWPNGGDVVGLVPTRYPGSESFPNPHIRMARRTEWISDPGGGERVVGQRTLVTNQGEVPLLEVRRIDLAPWVAEAPGDTVVGSRNGGSRG